MDANKLANLREMGYRIGPCCAMCQHGTFRADNWGTCNVHLYEHLKHTGPARQLSIHRYGRCSEYQLDPNRLTELHAFAEFAGP